MSKYSLSVLGQQQAAGDAGQRQPAVPNELDILKANLDRLGKAVGELGTRLEPVLSQVPDRPPPKEQEIQRLPGLADAIRDCHRQADAIRESVEGLIGRLEI